MSTLPGFPLETKFGMKCQIAAAAPGVEFPAQTFCRVCRMYRAALGSSPEFPVLGSQTPQCPGLSSRHRGSPWGQGSQGIPFWMESPSLPHQHRAQTLWNYGHGKKKGRKGKCHPGSCCAAVHQWEEDPADSHGSVWPQELFLTHLEIHPVKPPQFQNSLLQHPLNSQVP